MCGIFGIVGPGARDPSVDVRRALAAMNHRGPDASGIVRLEGATLGHVRLSILDLTPGGAQPMQTPDGRFAVTFNGEIYNHHELRDELRAHGVVFRSRSDTEVLLEGYRLWGDAVVEKLDGMFAFGAFSVERGELLLATDRAGKKPLYWALRDGTLWFGSEVKALSGAGLDLEPDTESLPLLLAFGYVPAPRTIHAGVNALPPASRLLLRRDGSPRVSRYYRPPFDAPRVTSSLPETERELRHRFEAAVARRMEADVPVGAFLSGGIDSTLVVGAMARHSTRPVKTFSIGFSGDPRFDETEYARVAAKFFRTEHTEFVLEPTSFDLVERLVWHHDGPFGDSSAIPTSVVSMLTRRHVTVALSGDGGDEAFCGYPRLVAAELAERIPEALRAALARWSGTGHADGATSRHRIRRFARALGRPLADRLHGWITFFDCETAPVLRHELATSAAMARAKNLTREIVADWGAAPPLARALAYNFDTYLPYDLLVKADRCSMAHSLEVRSPFLDTGLLDLAARLPAKWLRRGTSTKWILKRACSDLLPPAIAQRRRKMGFGVPLDTWFRTTLRDYVHDMLGDGARLEDWIEPELVRDVLGRHDRGVANNGLQLWLLLTIEVWLRKRREWVGAPPAMPAAA